MDDGVELDRFADPLFAEPRTGGISEILILGQITRRARLADLSPERSVAVGLEFDAPIDFATTAEAQRFVAAIAAVCDDFGLDCPRSQPDTDGPHE